MIVLFCLTSLQKAVQCHLWIIPRRSVSGSHQHQIPQWSLLHPSFNSPSRPDRPSPAPYSRHFLAVPAFELQQSVCAALNFIYLELRKPPIWVARANFHTVFVCKAIVARLQCARQTIYARWAARPLYIQGIKVSG